MLLCITSKLNMLEARNVRNKTMNCLQSVWSGPLMLTLDILFLRAVSVFNTLLMKQKLNCSGTEDKKRTLEIKYTCGEKNVDSSKKNPHQRMDGCDGVKELSFPKRIKVNSGGKINLKCSPKGCLRIFSAVFDCKGEYNNRMHTATAKSLCEGKSKCTLHAEKEKFFTEDLCKG